MVTTKDPYYKKIGKNIANHFLVYLTRKNIKLASLIFMDNEREAIGRRILIAIRLLEQKTQEEIMSELSCGKNSVTLMRKKLNRVEDQEKVLKQLREVYTNQFQKEYITGLSYKKYPNIFNQRKGVITKIDIIED